MQQDNTADDSREDEDFEELFNDYADKTESDGNIQDEVETNQVDDVNDDVPETPEDDNTDNLKQQIEVLRKERDDFEHSFKSQVGRVSALQKKIDSEAPATKKIDAKLASAMEDYSEIVMPMMDHFERKYSELEQRLAPIQQQNERQDEQRYINSQLVIINDSHPDWREVIKSDDYMNWLGEQPKPVQEMAKSYEARDYQYLIGSFQGTKNKSNELAQRRQSKLASNVSVQSKGASKSTSAPDDFGSAWEYYANKKK